MSTKMSTKMSTDSSTNEVRSTDDGSQIQTNVEVLNNSNPVSYECDYLVVGAGTCGMSFIDTILTENSSATVILVDRNDRPGGHWTTAYPFVKLHQASGNYGVNSERLGKSRNKKGYEKIDPDDRATGEEIVEYFGRVLEKFKTQSNGRFKAFFNSEYRQEEYSIASTRMDDKSSTVHSIVSSSDDILFIRCKKIVMVKSKVVVPSMREAPFPVHEDVNYTNVNRLPEVVSSGAYTNYVVIGAGKTGSDAVVELLRSGVDQSCIKWIISQDIWYLIRENSFDAENHYQCVSKFFEPLLKVSSMKEMFLEYERIGIVGRLDSSRNFPKVFKSPCMDSTELQLLRSIKDVVRLGRISSIEAGGVMKFGKENAEQVPLTSSNDTTIFVDCMAEEFFGYASMPLDLKIFESNKINIGPMFAVFNPSFSSSLVAYLEANIDNDSIKNKCLFWTKQSIPTYEYFLSQLYTAVKTLVTVLETYPPSADFVLNARTNGDAPIHHGFGKFLWSQFGPSQMAKKAKQVLKKVESGGILDSKVDAEMIEREKPEKIRLTRAERREISKKRHALNKIKFLKSYPPNAQAYNE